MKRRKILSILLACTLAAAPAAQAMAATSYEASTEAFSQILFPGDSLTGLGDIPLLKQSDGSAVETEEGGWTNSSKGKVYRAYSDEEGAIQVERIGYTLTVEQGTASRADGDAESEKEQHYQFSDEDMPEVSTNRVCFEAGDKVLLTADTPEEGMEFAGWQSKDDEVSFEDASQMQTVITMPEGGVTVTATYREIETEPATYAVTVNNGSDVSGAGAYAAGTWVDITAADRSSEDLQFAGWIVESGNAELDDVWSASTGFVMPEGAVTVTAQYASPEPLQPETYSLTVVYGTASGDYEEGEQITITADDRSGEGMEFAGWYVESMNVQLDSTVDTTTWFTMPADEVIVAATYTEIEDTDEVQTEVPAEAGEGDAQAAEYGAEETPAATEESEYTEIPVAAEGNVEEETPAAEEGSEYVEIPTAAESVEEETPAAEEGSEYAEIPTAAEGNVEEETPTATEGSEYVEIPTAAEVSVEEKTPAAEEGSGYAEAPVAAEGNEQSETPAATDETEQTGIPAAVEETEQSETPAATESTEQSETPAATESTEQSETPAATEETEQSETTDAQIVDDEIEQDELFYTVTVVNGAGSGEYVSGDKVTIEAAEQEGKTFVRWTTDDPDVQFGDSSSQMTSFRMPGHEVTVTAEYQAATFEVTIDNGGGDVVTEIHTQGEVVTLTASDRSDENLEFASWIGTAQIAGVETELTFDDASSAATSFVMPGGPVSVTAVYSEIVTLYHVTVANGTINGSQTEIDCEEGTEITLTADPSAAGQAFSYWEVSDGTVDLGDLIYSASVTVTVSQDMDFRAVYEGVEYSVTVNSGSSNYESCTMGTKVTISADDAPTGMVFDYWYVDSENTALDDSSSSKTTFIMPEGNVTVSAHYRKVQYQLSVENGSSEAQYYYAGDQVTISSDYPASGREFDAWVAVSGNVTFADSSRWKTTFTMPASNVVVKASYKDGPSVNNNQILDLVEGGEYYIEDPIKFTASGAGMENTNPNPGDYRYRPSSYQIGTVTGTWQSSPYTTTMAIKAAGEYTLKVIFNRDVFDGSAWVSDGTVDTKSVTFKVVTQTSVATGDTTPIVAVVGVMAVALVVFIIVLVWYLRRRKK